MSDQALTSLVVDQLVPAEAETVFRALTEPDLYAQWMGPVGSTTTIEEMDVVPGGRLAFVVSFGEMSIRLSGRYVEVDAPRRLVHTWQAEGEELVTTVTIALNPVGAETHVLLTHEGFADEDDRQQNIGGWKHQLERLASVVAS